jgi:dolichyl-phosphate-mannose--protein O-mannosyl transferase
MAASERETRQQKHGYRLCDRIPSFKVLRICTDYLSVTCVIIRLLFIRLFKRVARVALIAIPFLKFDNRQKTLKTLIILEIIKTAANRPAKTLPYKQVTKPTTKT